MCWLKLNLNNTYPTLWVEDLFITIPKLPSPDVNPASQCGFGIFKSTTWNLGKLIVLGKTSNNSSDKPLLMKL